MRLLGYITFYVSVLLLIFTLCLIALLVAFAIIAHDYEPVHIAAEASYPLVLLAATMWVGNHLVETNPRR